MYEDSADSVVFENLFSAVYAHHPIRNNIAGTVESIGRITSQTLYDCYHGFYTPENMMLCVVGDVDPEQVFAMAEQIVPNGDGVLSVRNYGLPETMAPAQRRVERSMEVAMPMFAITCMMALVPEKLPVALPIALLKENLRLTAQNMLYR